MDKLISSTVSRTSRFRNASRALGAGTFRRFWKDTYGGAMIYIGLSLPVLLGFSGMAVDGSIWFANKRSMQATADAAAFSAALEMTRINDDTLAKTRAKLDAKENHYDPTTGDTIAVNSPPLYGPYEGNNAAFEAIVSRPSPSFLSRLIHGEQVTVTARAVAIVANPGGTPCVLSLESEAQDGVMINNGSLNSGGCRVQANSRDPQALRNFSNGVLDATTIKVVGGYDNSGTMTSTPTTGALPVPDPFAGIPTPAVGSCDHIDASYSGKKTFTLYPGTYCGGISVSGKATVNFEPGNYVITDSAGNPGSLHVTGNQATVTGSEVMFYTDGESTINVAGNGVVDLKAPTSGPYTGMLFYGNPYASDNLQHTVTGNGTMLYDGFMYFRNSVLKVNGNGTGVSSNYMGAVARQLRFGGNGEMIFQYDPTQPGVPIIAGGSTVTMVE